MALVHVCPERPWVPEELALDPAALADVACRMIPAHVLVDLVLIVEPEVAVLAERVRVLIRRGWGGRAICFRQPEMEQNLGMA